MLKWHCKLYFNGLDHEVNKTHANKQVNFGGWGDQFLLNQKFKWVLAMAKVFVNMTLLGSKTFCHVYNFMLSTSWIIWVSM
jgi:hypothetical protein